ncbi:TPA: hypothetical protein HA265_02625, partial [Candidatus Woesearchaeota archaeon]|nr:hypothetical protein [Candidatus Woesearchaeota archaeon]
MGIEQTVKEIAEKLHAPKMSEGGTIYRWVVQDAVFNMSGGRVSAQPISPDGSQVRVDEMHQRYLLSVDRVPVGELIIEAYPTVTGDQLMRGVKGVLDA